VNDHVWILLLGLLQVEGIGGLHYLEIGEYVCVGRDQCVEKE